MRNKTKTESLTLSGHKIKKKNKMLMIVIKKIIKHSMMTTITS